MLEILFNATVPGACINAVYAAEERERQNKQHRHDECEFDKPGIVQTSRLANSRGKLISLFDRPRKE